MPLLGVVRAGYSKGGRHRRIPSHVNEAVEMALGGIGVERRHLRAEVINRYDGAHRFCHIGDVSSVVGRSEVKTVRKIPSRSFTPQANTTNT